MDITKKRALNKVKTIYDTLLRVFEISKRDQIPSYIAADRMAEERIAAKKQSRSQFLLNEHHILSRR